MQHKTIIKTHEQMQNLLSVIKDISNQGQMFARCFKIA